MANLTHIAPLFIVSDLEISLKFYTEKLGFKILHMSPGENPFFAMVGRDMIAILLKEISPRVKPLPNNTLHEWARWDAFIYTEDPQKLFEEFRAGGIGFRQQLKKDEDGLTGFEISDADGYVLFFGRPEER
jgi:catechol 2,3-dioxygenase-like lactoylglutathione lyase family enzyme